MVHLAVVSVWNRVCVCVCVSHKADESRVWLTLL